MLSIACFGSVNKLFKKKIRNQWDVFLLNWPCMSGAKDKQRTIPFSVKGMGVCRKAAMSVYGIKMHDN